MKKVAIVGITGRTGTLFAEELKRASYVLGIGSRDKISKIKDGLVFVSRNGEISSFEIASISKDELNENLNIDYLFLATKNPVSKVLKEYLPKFKGKLPDIILSQNGFKAGEEARSTIDEIFHIKPNPLHIIRIVLFNAVKEVENAGNRIIEYKLPVRIAFSVFEGEEKTEDLEEIFTKAHIEFTKVSQKDVKNMEYLKLFTNLVGIPSFARGLDIYEGLKNKEVFKEEVQALKEFIKVVRAKGGRFLNFPHYPIGSFAFLVEHIPLVLLVPFHSIVARLVLKIRGTKEKENIDEIDYYTGAVVELGREVGIPTPINESVLRRIKNERDA